MVYLINLYKELKKSRGNVLKYALHSTVLLFNVQNQTCEAGGVWSGGGPIACTFVDCGDVPGLLNGGLGFGGVSDVRVGRIITLDIAGDDRAKAEAEAKSMADRLLANAVIESYKVEVA